MQEEKVWRSPDNFVSSFELFNTVPVRYVETILESAVLGTTLTFTQAFGI